MTYHSHQEEGQPSWLARTQLDKMFLFLCSRLVLYTH